jgi:hypothetical protein
MSDMKLSLKQQNSKNQNNSEALNKKECAPLMGWLAVVFGFLGIFTFGFIFVPLGFLFSVLAFFRGQALGGFVGLLLAVMGLITSPKLLLLIGMAAFAHWFDWSEFVQPMYDMIGVDTSKGEDI